MNAPVSEGQRKVNEENIRAPEWSKEQWEGKKKLETKKKNAVDREGEIDRKQRKPAEALNLLDKSTSALSDVVVAGGPEVVAEDAAEVSAELLVVDVAPERLVCKEEEKRNELRNVINKEKTLTKLN